MAFVALRPRLVAWQPGFQRACLHSSSQRGSLRPRPAEPVDYERLSAWTVQPVQTAKSLHPAFYFNEDWLKHEQETIFHSQWFAAAHVQELAQPGDVKVVDIGEQSFILTRDKAHKIHAFYNTCRHRGSRLASNCAKNVKQLVCPYHWWAYRLDGSLKSTPPSAQPKERKETLGLIKVPGVESFAGIIFLNQNPLAVPLHETLGDLPAKLERYDFNSMRLHAKKQYDIQANWKLVAENFVDFYHINAVHPALSKFSRVDDHLPYQGNGQYVGFVTSPLTDYGGPGDSVNFNSFERINRTEKGSALFFQIFPNVSVTLYPHSMYTLITHPSSTGRTQESLNLLMAPGAKLDADDDNMYKTKCDSLMDFVVNINDEDVRAIEPLHQGLRMANLTSTHGEFLPEYDWTIHRFQNMVLGAARGEWMDESLSPNLDRTFEQTVCSM